MKEYHQFTLLPGRCETERCISLTKFWYQAEAKGKYTKCMALETAQNTLMTCCTILQWQNKAMCSKSLRKREQKVFVSRRLAQLCLLLHYVIVRRSAVTDDFCLVPLTTTPFSWMQTDNPSVPVPLNRKKKSISIDYDWLLLRRFEESPIEKWLLRLQDLSGSRNISRALSQVVLFSRIRSDCRSGVRIINHILQSN